jgi:multicomponent Na+:H+ antiporter subunit E
MATWVAMWGDVRVGNLVGGAVVATSAVALLDARRLGNPRLRPSATLRFVLHVAWNLVVSTTRVAWEVVTPRSRMAPGIVALALPGSTPVVRSVVNNAIGLTPGTLVVHVDDDPCVAYVHALYVHDLDATRAELEHLRDLAMAAFGPLATGGAT